MTGPDRTASSFQAGKATIVAVPEPGCLAIRVSGEIDVSCAEQIERRIKAAGEPGGQIAVDLSELEFIDSSGIATLIRCHQHHTAQGQDFLYTNPSAQVTRVVTIMGLADVLGWPDR